MDADATRPLASDVAPDPAQGPGQGQLVGRYVVLGEIGRGGEGQVFEAFDTELERKVALKLLHGGSATLAARREARAQAKLDHPAVVSIFDVGDADGQAYIAMELMSRESFARWCANAAPSEVLEALRRVAGGIQAAHAAGLVHGDIKPSNILRSVRGEAKLSDFGVARASDRAGAQLAGTRAFMAPELFAQVPASPASDQYAFCLTAWMAFHGPLAPRDSVAQTDHDSAETSPSNAGPAVSEPVWSAGVPGPVREALTRGLASDPAQRWPSMAALAQALVPPAPRTPARRSWLAAGTVLAVGLGGAVAVAAGDDPQPCAEASAPMDAQWGPARRASALAPMLEAGLDPAAEATAAALDAYAQDWVAQSTDSCRATHVHQRQSALLLDRRTACLDGALEAFGLATDVLAGGEAKHRAHALLDALPPLSACEAPRAPEGPSALPDDPDARARIREALVDVDRLEVLRIARRDAQADALVASLAPRVEAYAHPPLTLSFGLAHARLLREHGALEEAATLGDRALSQAVAYGFSDEARQALELLGPLRGFELEQPQRSRAYTPMLLAYAEDDARAPEERAAVFSALSTIDHAAGDYAQGLKRSRLALDLQQQAKGADIDYASMLNDHALLQHMAGEHEAAVASHEEAEALRRKLLGERHPDVAQSLDNRAQVLLELGRIEEARAAIHEALDILRDAGVQGHRWAIAHNTLGLVHAKADEWSEAADALRVALTYFTAAYGEDNPNAAVARASLGTCLGQLHDYDAALELLETSNRIELAARGADHPARLNGLAHYGELLCLAGRPDEGLTKLREAVALGERVLGPGHGDTIYVANLLALSLYKAERFAEAVEVASKALEDHARGPGGSPNNVESLQSIVAGGQRALR